MRRSKIEAMMDARIEQALTRLARIKDIEKLYGQTAVALERQAGDESSIALHQGAGSGLSRRRIST